MQKAEHIVDVKGQPLGRVATKIASLLQGKGTAAYEPRKDGNIKVIIKNIKLIKVTGRKADQKIYYSHTTQIGHLKERKYREVFDRKPEWVLQHAVKGMLPKNKLAIKRLKNMTFEI